MKETEIVERAQPLQTLNHWLEIVTKFFITISAFMVIIMALTTTYSVIRRYLFSSPDNNAFLVTCIVCLTFAVFSWAEVQRLHKHIVVDYFSDRFNQTIQNILKNIITPILGLFFCAALLWKNWVSAAFSWQIGEKTVTNIVLPVFPFRVMIILGVGLICMVLVAQLVTYLIALKYHANHQKPKLA